MNGLYDPRNEHDACGVGFVANIKGRKSHAIVEQGLTVLKNLTHRGAVGWDPKLSDGAGCLIQIPDKFFREEMAKLRVKLPPAGQYGVGMVFLRATRLRASPASTRSSAQSRKKARCCLAGATCRWTIPTWPNRRSAWSP